MSAPARWWPRETLAGLGRDPFVRAFAAVAGVEVVLYVTPLIGPVERAYFGRYFYHLPALGLLVAGTFAGLRPIAERGARMFWRMVGAGFGCWFVATVLAATITDMDARRSVDVTIDSAYLASGLIPLVAIAWRPHLGSGEAALTLDRLLRSAGIVMIAGGWFTYFVLVPAVVNPGFYASIEPSFFGYLSLDVMLASLSLLSAVSTGNRHWRRTYLVFAAAALYTFGLDVLDLLSQNGTFDLRPGSRTDLLWLTAPALYLIAARLRHLPVPPAQAERGLPPAGDDGATPVRTAGILLAGAFTFPLVHIWLGTIPFATDAVRRPQTILVLVVLVVLALMATAGYGALARRYRSLEAGRQSLEDHLRETQRMETVGRLAGSVAHDFNNLLTAISGYNELAMETLPPDDPNRPLLDEVRRSAAQAQALTRQLLAFSRRQVLTLEPLDLGRTVEAVAPMIARIIGEDIALETRLGAGLGLVMADPRQIESALLNLAGNARDAMPHGGRLTIVADNLEVLPGAVPQGAAPGPGRYIQIVVRDTGGGIAPEALPHIFEPFFSTKERAKGTGLGLASVYGIVTQFGGTITATSEAGRGAAFTILLPRADEEPPAPSPALAT